MTTTEIHGADVLLIVHRGRGGGCMEALLFAKIWRCSKMIGFLIP